MHLPSSCQKGHGCSRFTRKYRKNVRDVIFSNKGEKNLLTLLSTLLKSQLQSEIRPSSRTDWQRRHWIKSRNGLKKKPPRRVLGRTSNNIECNSISSDMNKSRISGPSSLLRGQLSVVLTTLRTVQFTESRMRQMRYTWQKQTDGA